MFVQLLSSHVPTTYYTCVQVIYLLVPLQRTSLVELSRIIWFLWTSAEEMYTTQMQCVMLLSSCSNHTLVKLCFIERNTCSMVWGRSSCWELNPESLTWAASALCGCMVVLPQWPEHSQLRARDPSTPIDYLLGYLLSTSLYHTPLNTCLYFDSFWW